MTLNTGFQSEAIFAGHLLGVKGSGGIGLFDWQTGALARRIEVEPLALHWSESGELVALACADSYYVLRFDRNAYDTAVGEGEVEDDGVESAFEVITDVNEGESPPRLAFHFLDLGTFAKNLQRSRAERGLAIALSTPQALIDSTTSLERRSTRSLTLMLHITF